MTNKEYLNKLIDISGVKDYENCTAKRKLNITVAHDDYGQPSTAIIAFNGSPPRFEVIFRIRNDGITPFMVNGRLIGVSRKWLKESTRRNMLHIFLCKFLYSRKSEWNINLEMVQKTDTTGVTK